MHSALPLVLAVIAFNPAAFPQALPPSSTETLRANIRTATERNAAPEQAGKLWLILASRYHDRFELEKAEDAYAHAIHLLSDSSSQKDYAEALNGMGTVYAAVGRLREARKCLTKSLDIYTTLNDEANMAHLHLSLGLESLAEQNYREAEMESTAALKGFNSIPNVDFSEVSMAHLTRSRAICGQGQCRAALDDVTQAFSLTRTGLLENSIAMISIWLVQGQVQMKAGLEADAKQSMNDALRLVESRTDLPRPYFVALELTVLRAQSTSLKAAHRKQEAKHTEDQIRRIEADAPATCTRCTVSAASLMSPGMR